MMTAERPWLQLLAVLDVRTNGGARCVSVWRCSVAEAWQDWLTCGRTMRNRWTSVRRCLQATHGHLQQTCSRQLHSSQSNDAPPSPASTAKRLSAILRTTSASLKDDSLSHETTVPGKETKQQTVVYWFRHKQYCLVRQTSHHAPCTAATCMIPESMLVYSVSFMTIA